MVGLPTNIIERIKLLGENGIILQRNFPSVFLSPISSDERKRKLI